MEGVQVKDFEIKSTEVKIENEEIKKIKISNENKFNIEFVAVEIQDIKKEEHIKIEEIVNSEIGIKEEPFGFQEGDLFLEEEVAKSEEEQRQEETNSVEFCDLNSVAEDKYQKLGDINTERRSARWHHSSTIEPSKREGIESIEDVTTYECTKCNEPFTDAISLSKHVLSCNEFKAFESRKLDKCHIKKVCISGKTNFRPLKCNECDYSCGAKCDLTRHIRAVHLKEKRHKCNECNRSFSTKYNLSAHIRAVHDKEKLFQCTECNNFFSSKNYLKSHILVIHEKVKPFQCSECTMAFGREHSLKFHILAIHRKVKPFQCTECTMAFARKSSLKRHILVIHKEATL